MDSEITYAEVRIKNESNSLGTYSECPAVPREKPTHHPSKPGSRSLLFTSLMVFLLLLTIAFLGSFIIYFQKYSQLLEEKKALTDKTLNDLNCTKNVSLTEDKVCSCCLKDWKSFGSYCYFTSTDSNATWDENKEKCSRMGAHLLVIHSQDEQDFINTILNIGTDYFIGLSDHGENQWQWIDQTPYNESVTFWHKGEPNNKEEKCVVINHRDKWGWNDIPCHDRHKSVCQVKKIHS